MSGNSRPKVRSASGTSSITATGTAAMFSSPTMRPLSWRIWSTARPSSRSVAQALS
jgi:hypothetical protein